MKSNGAVFYRGPSLLDGSPIVGIVVGFNRHSKNRKTGDMLQTYILRSHVDPVQAVNDGRDVSICGDCKLRARTDIIRTRKGVQRKRSRPCYVQVKNAPLSIWRAYKRGNYKPINLSDVHNRVVRIGAYGDPAAIPTFYWQALLTYAKSWTGYTHQWRDCDPALADICMASVDSEYERIVADARGWRTFRTRTKDAPILDGEVMCPASAEAGYRTTCLCCKLCSGKALPVKSVTIIVHGAGASSFVALSALRTVQP